MLKTEKMRTSKRVGAQEPNVKDHNDKVINLIITLKIERGKRQRNLMKVYLVD